MKETKLYLLILLVLFGCYNETNINEDKIKYENIDEKIDCYENATSLFKFISEDRNQEYQSEVFRALNEFIIHLNYMCNQMVNEGKNEKERKELIATLNKFVGNNTKKCLKKIGEFHLKPSVDSSYYYNMKISYIECILNTSKMIDSVDLICPVFYD